jgi:hypothetical protein
MIIEYTISITGNQVSIKQRIELDEGASQQAAAQQEVSQDVVVGQVVDHQLTGTFQGPLTGKVDDGDDKTGSGGAQDKGGVGGGGAQDKGGFGGGGAQDKGGFGGGTFAAGQVPIVILGPVIIGPKVVPATRADAPE